MKVIKKDFFILLLMFFLIISSCIRFSFEFKCGTDMMNKKRNLVQKYKNYHDDGNINKRFMESNFESIRISIDFYNLETFPNLDSEFISNSKAVVNKAISLISKTTNVVRLTKNIEVSNCDIGVDFTITNSIRNGVEADLLIFIIIDNSEKANKITFEAWATHCQQDLKTLRPTVGVIGLSLNGIDFKKKKWFEYYTYLIYHEILHVLGLNNYLFSDFYDQEKETKKPIDSIIKSNIEVNGILRTFVITPKVVEAARKHFNCPSLEGVELENQGEEGSANSHWEARTMLGDILIAISYDELSLSSITCAFLEDTGWYKVDCYNGGLFKFGMNKGCKFINEKCIKNNKALFEDQFCDDNMQSKCMVGDKSKGICIINTKSGEEGVIIKSNNDYQYFDNNIKGGFFYSDFCPIVNSFYSSDSHFPGSCELGNIVSKGISYETIGKESGCLMSSLVKISIGNEIELKNNIPICYKYKCNFSNTSISVYLGKEIIVCAGKGGILKVEGYLGQIICPNFNDYCTGSFECSSIIDCIDKKSISVDKVSIKDSTNTFLLDSNKKAKPINSDYLNSNDTELTIKKLMISDIILCLIVLLM